MYSFAQRDDTIVKDEPFYGYYLKQSGAIHPGRIEIMNSMSTDIKQITTNLLAQNRDSSILFLKNMAHHHIGVDVNFLLSVKNVFLIRHPSELIASFSKVINFPTLDDIGLKKSWELYFELSKAGQKPVVIDSGELLKNPKSLIEKLCKAVDIPYNKKMLSWPTGARSEDGVWAKYWYTNLHKTTKFAEPKRRKAQAPKHLKSLCDDAKVYYDKLYKISLMN